MEEDEMRSLESWEGIDANLNLSRLEHLEGDAVSIQCVNSSEFVIGKQTNFNGPVTIINCANGLSSEIQKVVGHVTGDEEEEEEKIVIRDQVLSKKAETVVQEMGERIESDEDPGKTKGSEKSDDGCQYLFGWLAKDLLKIPVGVWILVIGLLTGLTLILTLSFSKTEVIDGEIETPTCDELIVRHGKRFCMYSKFTIEQGRTKIERKEPAAYVVVFQTEGSFCYDHNYCALIMESRSKGDPDEGSFPCNFLIGGEGNVYEEHGWSQSFALEKSYRICFMGDFNSLDFPTFPQVEGTKALIEYGVMRGFIAKDYVLVASNATVTDGTKNLVENTEINRMASNETLHRIYTKADWNGSPPISSVDLKLPVAYVIISHSGTPRCTSFNDCAQFVRNVQAFHMSDDYADIGYNFVVDPEGNIYEGRGWSKRNVIGGFVNNRNIDINIIGDYSRDLDPTPEQMASVKYLIQYGVENGMISKNFSLIPANATYPTLSPGKNVYKIIKNWPHFDSDPLSHVKDYDE